MNNEDWIQEHLAELTGKSLDRHLQVRANPDGLVNMCSNDYLGLSNHAAVIAGAERLLEKYGAGATASRLVTGSLPCHEELESRLAEYKGYPSSLVFGSGYLANIGSISAIVGRDDHVFMDRLVHASIVDAAVLARAQIHRFRHNDPAHLEGLLAKCPAKGKRLVVTESVFSMDGDLAPLPEIARVAPASGAMVMVDEAHATGVFGSGPVKRGGLEGDVNVSMGTLSKALGGYGGFVACSADMRGMLINRARGFIYTTALPPACVGAALAALDLLESEPGMGDMLLQKAGRFREQLASAGFNTLDSASQIIPVVVGSSENALSLSRRLDAEGILTIAIRPPTVPQGSARLRLSVTAAHTDEDLEKVREALIRCGMHEGVV